MSLEAGGSIPCRSNPAATLLVTYTVSPSIAATAELPVICVTTIALFVIHVCL